MLILLLVALLLLDVINHIVRQAESNRKPCSGGLTRYDSDIEIFSRYRSAIGNLEDVEGVDQTKFKDTRDCSNDCPGGLLTFCPTLYFSMCVCMSVRVFLDNR